MLALRCYRCGADLARLTLPLSRRDQCPSCRVDLHVCLMCVHYDPHVVEQCTEDDALDVREKARANFCDYFTPNENAYVPGRMSEEQKAQAQLDALFGSKETASRAGDDQTASADDVTLSDAEALFKR